MSIAGDDMDRICEIIDDMLLHDTPTYVDEYTMTDIKYTYNMVLESILDGIREHCYYDKDKMLNKIAEKIHRDEGEEIDGYKG